MQVMHVHSSTCLTLSTVHGVKAAAMIFAFIASFAAVDGELGDDEDGKKMGARVKLTESSLCMGMSACIQMLMSLLVTSRYAPYIMAKEDIEMSDGVPLQTIFR